MRNSITVFNSVCGGGSTLSAVICAIDLLQFDSSLMLYSNMSLKDIFYIPIKDLSNIKKDAVVLLDDLGLKKLFSSKIFCDSNTGDNIERNIHWVIASSGHRSSKSCARMLDYTDNSVMKYITDIYRSYFVGEYKLLLLRHYGTSAVNKIMNVNEYFEYFDTLSIGCKLILDK